MEEDLAVGCVCDRPFIRVLSSPARLSMKATASASLWKRMPQLHSAPTDLRDLGGSTCLSSTPCAYAHTCSPAGEHNEQTAPTEQVSAAHAYTHKTHAAMLQRICAAV